MKNFKRAMATIMVVLMVLTSAPLNGFVGFDWKASAVNEEYNLLIEETCADSSSAENSTEGEVSFFSRTEFDGCYGNQLSDVARELYDSLVKNYATDMKTGEYNYAFKTPFTFNAEISEGRIVMNDELEEIYLIIGSSMQAAMDAFLYDHPEVFWLQNMESSYNVSASGNSVTGYKGVIEEITIIPTEIYSAAASKISQYNSAVESALADIKVSESRYDTLKNIHDYICENAWYNLINEQRVHSSEPFFIGDGGVVCEGYAKAFKVICDRLEIPCALVSGYAYGAHMWNYVQMDDGKWYLVDATWDDQESKIYDTYFLANANTIGFKDITISEERTERNDFSGTGIFSFTYPVLSAIAYTVHVHEWESEYTIDKEPTCTENGSKSIHCKNCDEVNNETELPSKGHVDSDINGKCDTCDELLYEVVASGYCGEDGDNLTWVLDKSGVLTISGTGKMKDYYEEDGSFPCHPWSSVIEHCEKIVVEEGVESITAYAFHGFTGEKVELADSLVYVPGDAFVWNDTIESINIPLNLEKYSYDILSELSVLKYVYTKEDCKNYSVIDNGVLLSKDKTKLYSVISGCVSLNVPKETELIYYNAFIWSDNLDEIVVEDGNKFYSTKDGALYAISQLNLDNEYCVEIGYGGAPAVERYSETAALLRVPLNSDIEEFTVTDDTFLILPYAFCNSTLKRINISDSVRLIYGDVFSDCVELEYIKLSKNIEYITQNLFSGCVSLKTIEIPYGVTEIGYNAFENCLSLEEIDIPDSVTFIDNAAFYNCKNLKYVHISNNATYIGRYAFLNCYNLNSIQIPDSVVNIDAWAFGYCISLSKLLLPGSVETIGDYAFAGSNLETLEIPSQIKHIGYGLFCYCENLQSIVIPSSVKSIGESAFEGCESLESILYAGGEEQWKKINIDEYNDGLEKATVYYNHGTDHLLYEYINNGDGTHTLMCTVAGCPKKKVVDCSYGEWKVTIESTCALAGSKSKTCTTCGYTVTETIAKLPHTESELIIENRVEPKCEVKGRYEEVIYCSVCGEDVSRTVIEIPALEHKWNEGVIDSVSTCKTHGTKIYICQIDASHTKTDQIALDGDNHEGETYLKNVVDVSCSKDGYTGDLCCSGCDAKFAIGEKIPAYNHTEVIDKAVEPTCVKSGLTEGSHCSTCGEVIVAQDTVAKLAHSTKTTTTKATLTKNGKTETKCTVCGEVTKTTTIYYPKSVSLSVTSYTYNGKVKTPSVTVKDSKGKTLKKDTDYTVKYESGRKNPGKYTVQITFKGNYSGTKKLYFTIAPKTTTKIAASQTTTAIKLSWVKVTGATGYRVYKYNTKTKKFEKYKDVTGTSLTISKLSAGTKYNFRVRAYTKDGDVIWGDYSATFATATKPATPSLKITSTSKKKASLTWSNVAGESGYQIYYSTKKDSGFKKYTSVKTNTTKGTVSKLTSGKTYYFKVRAYTKTDSGTVYSSWSSVKSVKVK